jgi:hypothetical protein
MISTPHLPNIHYQMEQYPCFVTMCTVNTVKPRVSLCYDSLKTNHCVMTRWRRNHCVMSCWRRTTVLCSLKTNHCVMTRWRRTTVVWLGEDEPLCYDSLNHCVMTRWRRTTGNGISFRKIPRNLDSEWFPLSRGRKWSFRGIPRFNGRVNSEARNGTEWHEKLVFTKSPAPANRTDSVFSSEKCFGTEFWEFASLFVPRNEIPSWFLFCGMVWNGIPRVCFYFCSMVHTPSFFLLCGMIRNRIPRVFCSAEQPEFRRNKPVVPSIPSSAE